MGLFDLMLRHEGVPHPPRARSDHPHSPPRAKLIAHPGSAVRRGTGRTAGNTSDGPRRPDPADRVIIARMVWGADSY